MASNKNEKPDWIFGVVVFLLDLACLLPFYDKGIQWFDEGTQLRMAQRAIGENIGNLPPHGFPSFHWLYRLVFTVFPLTLHVLRLEVLLVMALGVGLFAVLGRYVLSRREMLCLLLVYYPFQFAFGPFAYYSREANLFVLLASLLLTLGEFRPRGVWTFSAAACFALATGFKFNIGLLGFAAAGVLLLPNVLGFALVFGLVLVLINVSSQTALFSTMVSMPASYAKAAYVAMPFTILFLFAASGFALWACGRHETNAERRRWIAFMAVLNAMLLLQDFPRHWLAHWFWIPMPFWLLIFYGCKTLRHSRMILSVLGIFAVLWGLREFKPWQGLTGPWVRLPEDSRLHVQVRPQQAGVLARLSSVVNQACDQPTDGIFVFPAQPFVYFFLNRPNVTSQDNFHGGYRWQNEVVHELTLRPPCAVVSIPHEGPWGLRGDQEAPRVFEWIYRPPQRVLAHVYAPGEFLFDILVPTTGKVFPVQ